MEIGSEFWKKPQKYIRDNDEIYLSGRTALDIIIKDAIENYSVTAALLPSYCCYSMIEPFLENNIVIRFYDVYVDESGRLVAEVPAPRENELIYIMKYFGDTDLMYVGEGCTLDGWCTTVEDLTHSCFSNNYKLKSEYWFTSYRKWFALDGIAVAGKQHGKLRRGEKESNLAYCQLRNEAFEIKNRFMNGEAVEKQSFLNIFSEADRLLRIDFREYGARPDTIANLCQYFDNIEQIRTKRRENAAVLIDGLSKINNIKIFADFADQSKCPLFVPIVVEKEKRDVLRKHLIDREIYCPVHWPISNYHVGLSEKAQDIYDRELSLVCDQRYSEEDMNRILKEINVFFEGE